MTLWDRTKMLFSGQQQQEESTDSTSPPTRAADPLAYLLEDGDLENQSKRYKNLYRNSAADAGDH